MRDVVIALIIGAIFFAGGGILTALAIRYATNTSLWDWVLWGGVALMGVSIATLAMFLSSQVTGRPFWLPTILINIGICAIVGGLVFYYSATTVTQDDHIPVNSKVSDAQFLELQELISLIGGKDEDALRTTFDFDVMIDRNIDIIVQMIGFIRAGRFHDFHLFSYSEGQVLIATNLGRWTTGPSGVPIAVPDPHDVYAIILPKKYTAAIATLVRVENSALVPESIVGPLKDFHETVDQDAQLLIEVLNSKLKEDEENFLQYKAGSSRYFGGIRQVYVSKFKNLKPKADIVNAAVKLYLGAR
jgi:hypothetical protein